MVDYINSVAVFFSNENEVLHWWFIIEHKEAA
jgi:hypothetical protein